jgi:hypothetical protein
MPRVPRTGLRTLKFVPDKFLRGAGLREMLETEQVLFGVSQVKNTGLRADQ